MANGDLLGVGASGLLAFQRALSTIGHNISNANTDGYSRQVVELSAQTPQFAANGYIGTGVRVDSVRRMYDEFLTLQVRNTTSSRSQLEGYYALASQVDGLLADAQSGLSPALQDFFRAVQGVADDPTSIPARQVMLSQAGVLTDRFHYLDQRLSDLDRNVNAQIDTAVTDINNLAASIASLNRDISQALGGGSTPPNDLLDKRDQLLAELAERVSVTTVAQDDGSLNVFIGNGQTLVVGSQAQSLSVAANEYIASRNEVGYTSGSSTVNISNQITGGTLGGLLQFRSEILDPARNALGRVAIGLSADFNAQHAMGQDLTGSLGGDFFSAIDSSSPAVRASSNNTGTASITVTVSDVAKLTTSDYRLTYAGGTYTVTRLSDNTPVYSSATFPSTLASEGLTFTLASGVAVAGDSFLIQPTIEAAGDAGVSVTDTRKIAAAAPIRTAATLTNTGTGRISAGAVTDATDANLQQTVTITFTSATTYNVSGTGTGNPTGLAYTSGGSISYNGWTVQITGAPAAGDVFTISSNTNGSGDNRNALLLAGLQNQQKLANSTATYQDAYGQLVSEVGSKTHAADVNRNAQTALLEQSRAARDAVSGVNLDEEAANLVRFQQAYQAAAQVIAVTDTLFQTLLSAVRR